MKRKLAMLAVAGTIAFMMSCATYPGVDSRLAEDLVDITKYAVGTNFTQFKTFSIVDSVTLIKDYHDSSKMSNPQTQALLSEIISNMEARGYTLVERKTGNPDLGINAGVIKVTNVSYYYPGWYWDYGYYNPSYWGYPASYYWYPYYPPAVSYYSTGTVIIELLDLKNAKVHDNKLYVDWVAIIRGLLTGSHTQQEVLDNVDQCFAQTPQLRAKLLKQGG
jgi:Domain of unknown function (DUF4136)